MLAAVKLVLLLTRIMRMEGKCKLKTRRNAKYLHEKKNNTCKWNIFYIQVVSNPSGAIL